MQFFDEEDTEMDPALLGKSDEAYAAARAALPAAVDEAAVLVRERGPAAAAALLAAEHFMRTGGNPHALAGALGTALVELARREVA